MALKKLSAEQARRRCDPAHFQFETTAELDPERQVFGQARALRALEFGINMPNPGYNTFVIGPNGSGRMSAILQQVRGAVLDRPTPPDYAYVHNFEQPRNPIALCLLPGAAPMLRDALDALIDQAQNKLPGAFDADAYDDSHDAIAASYDNEQSALMDAIQSRASGHGLTLTRAATGLDIVPADPNTQPAEAMLSARRELLEALDDAQRSLREAEKRARAEIAKLDATVADSIVAPLISDVLAVEMELVSRDNRDPLLAWLGAVKRDLIDNVGFFKPRAEALDPAQVAFFLSRYRVNVFVNNGPLAGGRGALVVYEENPTYYNLIGRIDRTVSLPGTPIMASNTVDHMMLRPGALHRANGGYLIVNARDLLDADHAFHALNRSLKRESIRIEEPNEGMFGGAPMIEAQPIPLAVKVIVQGNGHSYWEASSRDEAFRDFFKVRAEFVSSMPRTPETERTYGNFLRARSEEEGLPHFSREAVAWLVEYGSREVDDQTKLTARFGDLADIAREAAFWAKRNGNTVVQGSDMRIAAEERRYRLNRYEDDVREYTLRGGYYLETSGEEVGQINGMSVIDLGEYDFGKPARITARTYVMRGGINDMDRGVAYTDQSHNKGLALIDSYLSGLYSTEAPLGVSANVTFEQSLNNHEGDSASCAILLVMLSAVTGLPIPQSIAVTGTLDQSGFVRPIGGTSTKIEGFFDICVKRGLDGTHGAVIPIANAQDLMLREDVVAAVASGQFHLWTAEHVDDLIGLYFGMPAGQRNEEGKFAPGSVHALVEAALRENNDRLDGRRRGQRGEAAPDAGPTAESFDPMI
jgi:predicted ATP-dependent protease